MGNSLKLAVSKNSRECKICLHYLATFPFHTNKSGCDTNTLIVRKEGSDWLAVRQPPIKAALAKRHLSGGTLVLYDVSSSYLEGRCCPLAQFGYSRDGKRSKRQIVYGLLCAPDGCPVAIEVFAGSTADPTTQPAR